MARGTPATVALDKAGVTFKLHEYDYDPDALRIGMQAAEALGVSPSRLLKTLMAKAGSAVVCVLIASDREVSLKKLAAAAGAKDAAMLPPAEAERITGYHVGGISPFGQRKRVAVFVDAAALAHPTVIVNGGRRGLQIEIARIGTVRLLRRRARILPGSAHPLRRSRRIARRSASAQAGKITISPEAAAVRTSRLVSICCQMDQQHLLVSGRPCEEQRKPGTKSRTTAKARNAPGCAHRYIMRVTRRNVIQGRLRLTDASSSVLGRRLATAPRQWCAG